MKWINQRSQRRSCNWAKFSKVLNAWIPSLRIQYNLYPSILAIVDHLYWEPDGLTLQSGSARAVMRKHSCYLPYKGSLAKLKSMLCILWLSAKVEMLLAAFGRYCEFVLLDS